MAFDPASFGGGFGAGQQQARSEADHERNLANAKLNGVKAELGGAQDTSLALAMAVKIARDKNEALEAEINNRWIPYAVTLRASLVARSMERSVLIDELKRLDPTNVEAVVQKAEQARLAEYDSLEGAKLIPISQAIRKESEEGRLDR